MADVKFITRPLQVWPRPVNTRRRRSPYSATYTRTLQDLAYEVTKLGAKGEVVIQMDLGEADIRRDGLPYADVRVRSPRVAIFFACRHGPLTYYADAFLDWHDNVRAIVLGLQRLRLVEETGIISRGEQYTGFKQLGSGIPLGPSTMSVEEAARVVSSLSAAPMARPHEMLIGKSVFDDYWRSAVKRHHHDAGGKLDDWHRLQEAGNVLEKYFKEVGRG